MDTVLKVVILVVQVVLADAQGVQDALHLVVVLVEDVKVV